MVTPTSGVNIRNAGVSNEHCFDSIVECFSGNSEIHEKALHVANFIETFMLNHQAREDDAFDPDAVNIKIGIGNQRTKMITEIREYSVKEETLDELIIEDIDERMESLPRDKQTIMRLVTLAAEITLYKTDSLAPCFLAQLEDLPQPLWFESKLFKSIVYRAR